MLFLCVTWDYKGSQTKVARQFVHTMNFRDAKHCQAIIDDLLFCRLGDATLQAGAGSKPAPIQTMVPWEDYRTWISSLFCLRKEFSCKSTGGDTRKSKISIKHCRLHLEPFNKLNLFPSESGKQVRCYFSKEIAVGLTLLTYVFVSIVNF